MNTAKKYFQKQLSVPEFEQAYMEEKVKLDIEYQLEDLKKDIQSCKPAKELIKKKLQSWSQPTHSENLPGDASA